MKKSVSHIPDSHGLEHTNKPSDSLGRGTVVRVVTSLSTLVVKVCLLSVLVVSIIVVVIVVASRVAVTSSGLPTSQTYIYAIFRPYFVGWTG